MTHRLGIDIGGTFTDFVLLASDGGITTAKVLSNPADLRGVIGQGLEQIAATLDTRVPELLRSIELIVHGTTIATNALIQRRLAKVGMIGTDGFRDLLALREGFKEDVFDYFLAPPEPLVPRHLSLTVRERVDRDGAVLVSLHEDDVIAALEVFRRHRVEAIVVGLLWSVVNPVHERRVGEMVRAALPGVRVFLSSSVSPQLREYPRFSTAALCAALAERLDTYVQDLETNLRAAGFEGAIRYIQCNGGTTSAALLRACPVLALDSGPAAGPAAGLFFARAFGSESVVTLDMGGTSLDASLVKDGRIETEKNVDVHRHRVSVPMVGVRTIGAGGGSIAWLDGTGVLQVGPQSAESVPGPACYMRGGEAPTVTDANVVLGYFSGGWLLGGRMRIDGALASRAIAARIAEPLGVGLVEAAYAIHTVVNENMADAVRQISTERGYDIRDFVLVCGGGCSAAHAARIAESVGVSTVIVPRVSSVLCAFGAAITDTRHDYTRIYAARLEVADVAVIEAEFSALSAQAREDLALEGFSQDRIRLTRTMDVRYAGEVSELQVDVTGLDLAAVGVAGVAERFHALHEGTYTFSDPASACEVLALGVTAYGLRDRRIENLRATTGEPETPVEDARTLASEDLSGARTGFRKAWFDRTAPHLTPVYAAERLPRDAAIDGPAIIEETATTLVVPPEWRAEATRRHAWLMTHRRGASPEAS